MAIFDNFPYTNIHDLNLDWLVKTVKKVYDKTELIDQAVIDAQSRALSAEENAIKTENYFNALKKAFVTPLMFGAVGDGLTVDNDALNECFEYCAENNAICLGLNKTYLIDDSTTSLVGHYGVTVPGGCYIRDCNFKLKTGCREFTTLLACLYNENEYYFEHCSFEGELRTINIGAEDGGCHGIIFCDGNTMFPDDWQDFNDIYIINCNFKNIQSYGIFPTPINNKLIVLDTVFSAHGPAILSYATTTIIDGCSYDYLTGTNTTIKTLAIDEIENFGNATSISKNIAIKNCNSERILYQIQETPQRSVIYGDVIIENCIAGGDILHTYDDSGFTISADNIVIKDCKCTMAVGRANATGVFLTNINGNVTIDNFKTNNNANPNISISGNLLIKNTDINFSSIFKPDCALNMLTVENCNLVEMHDDFRPNGYFTTRGSTVVNIGKILMKDISFISSTNARILYGLNSSYIIVNDIVSTEKPIQLYFAESTQTSNIYVDGLIMLVGNPAYTYFIEKSGGVSFIRGMAPNVNTTGTTATQDVTAI